MPMPVAMQMKVFTPLPIRTTNGSEDEMVETRFPGHAFCQLVHMVM